MALENNLVVDSDAELKAFLSSILSSEGIVVNINRTFIAYNNGTNRNTTTRTRKPATVKTAHVFSRKHHKMAAAISLRITKCLV